MDQNRATATRLISTLRQDLTQGRLFTRFKREAREIEDFYLTQDERERIQRKGKYWRWLFVGWWILRSSVLKLTPFRRLLLVVGLILTSTDFTIQSGSFELSIHYRLAGTLCLLLLIVLELKDKLLARSELASGRAVQCAMNPERAPFIPGWNIWLFTSPANEVGGDLVDFLRLNGQQYGIVIGDVAGKGLGAALFMVKIQSTIRALAPDFESPSTLISKLNSILIRDGIPGKFASLVFLRIEPEGTLRYVNAGHMPLLVVSEGDLSEQPKGNVALGLCAGTTFESRDISLETGQSLIIYSDGLTEAQNEQGEFYGIERFKALCRSCGSIPAQSFGEKILQEVSAFEGDARRKDDLSLVILQKSA